MLGRFGVFAPPKKTLKQRPKTLYRDTSIRQFITWQRHGLLSDRRIDQRSLCRRHWFCHFRAPRGTGFVCQRIRWNLGFVMASSAKSEQIKGVLLAKQSKFRETVSPQLLGKSARTARLQSFSSPMRTLVPFDSRWLVRNASGHDRVQNAPVGLQSPKSCRNGNREMCEDFQRMLALTPARSGLRRYSTKKPRCSENTGV